MFRRDYKNPMAIGAAVLLVGSAIGVPAYLLTRSTPNEEQPPITQPETPQHSLHDRVYVLERQLFIYKEMQRNLIDQVSDIEYNLEDLQKKLSTGEPIPMPPALVELEAELQALEEANTGKDR